MFNNNNYGVLLSVLAFLVFVAGCEQASTNKTSFEKKENTSIIAKCDGCQDWPELSALVSKSTLDNSFISKTQNYISQSQTRIQSTTPLSVSFNIRGFCSDPASAEFTKIQDNFISGFENMAASIGSCKGQCEVKINTAEYCAWGNLLTRQSEEWPEISEAFQNAAILLDEANQRQRSILSQINIFMSAAENAATSSLTSSFASLLQVSDQRSSQTPRSNSKVQHLDSAKNITEQPALKLSDTELKLAIQELYELGSILQVLSWAGLSNNDGMMAGDRLVALSQGIEQLHIDIGSALTRTKVLEPNNRVTLVKRVVDALAELRLMANSLAQSQTKASQIRPNTAANAINPMAPDTMAMQAAAECFTKLSLQTAIVPEFSKIVRDELQSCRSFDTCPSSKSTEPVGLSEMIKRTLQSHPKDEKLMLFVQKSICK